MKNNFLTKDIFKTYREFFLDWTTKRKNYKTKQSITPLNDVAEPTFSTSVNQQRSSPVNGEKSMSIIEKKTSINGY